MLEINPLINKGMIYRRICSKCDGRQQYVSDDFEPRTFQPIKKNNVSNVLNNLPYSDKRT